MKRLDSAELLRERGGIPLENGGRGGSKRCGSDGELMPFAEGNKEGGSEA